MSNVLEIDRAVRRVRRAGLTPNAARALARGRVGRRRLAVAVAAVELLYVLGLVIAVPLGRGAVALTFVLAFAVAMLAGARVKT